ncbi:elements of external origin [Devosia sp. YIM 151766]|uniref:elements of external origin n=1 Tax=Devosia sp. YIM 151766 TaxID=3017325 RepID=UPI00255C45A1|nr:elements of external origin [Devosia sp. YIM 151766]WIY52450.1 elements of external origin [Devosia sp. YIM 151766]
MRKAIASGRISVEADGTIDPVRADAQWAAQTDPARQRGVHSQELGNETAAATASAKAQAVTRPVPNAAIDAVNETMRDHAADGGEVPPEPGDGGQVSFVRARMANEVLKAQTARVRLQKMKGELVDRSKATAAVFDLARRERDAWLNWPPRIAANMAAELGIEAHAMEQVLDKYLRQHLSELAEVKIDLR